MPLDEEYYFKDFEYTRKGRTTVVYTVAKFNFRRYPEAVYEVSRGRYGWQCTCPRGEMLRQRFHQETDCKHPHMIQEWLAAGKPSPFEHLFKEDFTKIPVMVEKKVRKKKVS